MERFDWVGALKEIDALADSPTSPTKIAGNPNLELEPDSQVLPEDFPRLPFTIRGRGNEEDTTLYSRIDIEDYNLHHDEIDTDTSARLSALVLAARIADLDGNSTEETVNNFQKACQTVGLAPSVQLFNTIATKNASNSQSLASVVSKRTDSTMSVVESDDGVIDLTQFDDSLPCRTSSTPKRARLSIDDAVMAERSRRQKKLDSFRDFLRPTKP